MIDKVRASKDGHEYHERWAARYALKLLIPKDKLNAISIEGLSTEDNKKTKVTVNEIADLALYYGDGECLDSCEKLEIVQFKYSIAKRNVPFRMSDAKKTITKFAKSESDYKKENPANEIERKIVYKLVTNRPILTELETAIKLLAGGKKPSGKTEKAQLEQLQKAIKVLGKKDQKSFLSRLFTVGVGDSLREAKVSVNNIIIDWSLSNDHLAKVRTMSLAELIRDKSGSKYENNNIVKAVDVLGALEIEREEDLLPSPESFPIIDKVIDREQLNEVCALILKLDKPLLIHADGGTGKTVFVQSIAKTLKNDGHYVVLFDCFGGGSYRSPTDQRHLPERGLLHIINSIACDGLCDIALPGSSNAADILRTAKERFLQAVKTWRLYKPEKKLIIIIDAADNAGVAAKDRQQESFPKLLLESLAYDGFLEDVQFVSTCRSHRKKDAVGDSENEEVLLKTFSEKEARSFLHSRIENCTEDLVSVGIARSEGNARVLEYLVEGEVGLLDKSQINIPIKVEELINQDIERAIQECKKQGYEEESIKGFLAGLAVLPTPIPIDEYALVHDIEISAVKSFVSDMRHLLDRTDYKGIVFRDEPTETHIRENYGNDIPSLTSLADRLDERQDTSIYAAKALPVLLLLINDEDRLLSLALDKRLPEKIKSDIGKRSIRKNRLNYALQLSIGKKSYEHLLLLITEMSVIASADMRGLKYISDNMDLVVASGDREAIQRILESKIIWVGKKYGRLAIANILSGESGEALRNTRRSDEWVRWYFDREEDQRNSNRLNEEDLVCVSFYCASKGYFKEISYELSRWNEEYAYRIASRLFELIQTAKELGNNADNFEYDKILEELEKCKTKKLFLSLSALLKLYYLSDLQKIKIIKKIAQISNKIDKTEIRTKFAERNKISNDLTTASLIASSLGLKAEAADIIMITRNERPKIHTYRGDPYYTGALANYILEKVIISVSTNNELRLFDFLPEEYSQLLEGQDIPDDKSELAKLIKKRNITEKEKAKESDKKEFRILSMDDESRIERIIDLHVVELLWLAKLLQAILSEPEDGKERRLIELLDKWDSLIKLESDDYRFSEPKRFFFDLGLYLCIKVMSASDNWSANASRKISDIAISSKFKWSSNLIRIVELLSKNPNSKALAGLVAKQTLDYINKEDDVDTKSSQYSALSRAILPASIVESSAYFRKGLNQLDSIGSGDVSYAYNLLQLCSLMPRNSLDDQSIHTLSNICELNLGEEAEKFAWFAFNKAFVRLSGFKILSKLCRWEDRETVSLSSSLPSMLTALLDERDIEADTAACIMRLVNPTETHSWKLGDFTKAVVSSKAKNISDIADEIVEQIDLNDPRSPWKESLKSVEEALKEFLPDNSEAVLRLQQLYSASEKRSKQEEQQQINSYQASNEGSYKLRLEQEEQVRNEAIKKELSTIIYPLRHLALSEAIEGLESVPRAASNINQIFFSNIRQATPFKYRLEHIKAVVELRNISLLTKLAELEEALSEWSSSSVHLDDYRKCIYEKMVEYHLDEIIGEDWGLEYRIKEISEISDVHEKEVSLYIIKYVTKNNMELSASNWMFLASKITPDELNKSSAEAVKRILKGDSARLTDSVTDGAWHEELYPKLQTHEQLGELIWFRLGSPDTTSRWRAAHTLRSLAKFGKWQIIGYLVSKIENGGNSLYSAPEVKSFELHSKLWLLISLSRIAIDFPEEVWKHKQILEEVIYEKSPNTAFRHFSAEALRNCISKLPASKDSKELLDKIESVNSSPFPKLNEKLQSNGGSYYASRPKELEKPEKEFYFDIDFEKYELSYLADIFGLSTWEIKDKVHEHLLVEDAEISNMYDRGGRPESYHSRYRYHEKDKTHNYGYYLCWHSLMSLSANLLDTKPITDDSYNQEPWESWLRYITLTRKDGLWLSDLTDRYPLACLGRVMCIENKKLVLPSSVKVFEELTSITDDSEKYVISGSWKSSDDVDIHIYSALVKNTSSKKVIDKLKKEKLFHLYLPSFKLDDEGEEYSDQFSCQEVMPWLVKESYEFGIDECDHFSSRSTMERSLPSKNIVQEYQIEEVNDFAKEWIDRKKEVVFTSEAWGSTKGSGEYLRDEQANRLCCTKNFLKQILENEKSNLLVILQLQRYEKTGPSGGTFINSAYLASIDKDLSISVKVLGANVSI